MFAEHGGGKDPLLLVSHTQPIKLLELAASEIQHA